jgi:oligosaccharyltransferase complex subunit epsilon
MQKSVAPTSSEPRTSPKKRPEREPPSSLTKGNSFYKIMNKLILEYQISTPQLVKIIDVYLLYIFLTGIVQGIYVLVARSSFPFNAMLAGWISCIGSFVFAGELLLRDNSHSFGQ